MAEPEIVSDTVVLPPGRRLMVAGTGGAIILALRDGKEPEEIVYLSGDEPHRCKSFVVPADAIGCTIKHARGVPVRIMPHPLEPETAETLLAPVNAVLAEYGVVLNVRVDFERIAVAPDLHLGLPLLRQVSDVSLDPTLAEIQLAAADAEGRVAGGS